MLTVAWNLAVGEGAVDAIELELLVDVLVTQLLLTMSVMRMRRRRYLCEPTGFVGRLTVVMATVMCD